MVLKKWIRVAGAALALTSLSVGTAFAGHEGCRGECYGKVYEPPVYGKFHRHVMVQPAVAYRHEVPATYAVVHQTVLINAPQVTWLHKRDHHGHKVLCKVVTPARYGTIAHPVMVRPPHYAYQIEPARYVTETHTVKLTRGGNVWAPVRHRYRPW